MGMMASTGNKKSTETPGKPMTMQQHVVDKGAQMMQSLKPIKEISEHVCTFAFYSHDMSRQIETHHFLTRLTQDVLQCAVYDSDDRTGRLIGVEYIISPEVFEALPLDEQKLWHSHGYEIKSGLWANPRMPEAVVKKELEDMAKTYGKFWCTWQVDRGDPLPLGEPALMVSPQAENVDLLSPELIKRRDERFKFSTEKLQQLRAHIDTPTWVNPNADYWKKHGKGFAVDVVPVEMKLRAPFP